MLYMDYVGISYRIRKKQKKNYKKREKHATNTLARCLYSLKRDMKNSAIDDKKLIAEFKSGNKKVFDTIVDAYSGKMFQVAYGLLDSHEDAEEVVQDALIRAYKAMDGFRGESSLDTWLHRIVVNLARNKYHWNRRRGGDVCISLSEKKPGLEDAPEEDMAIPDESRTPDGALATCELEGVMEKGMADLPENVRETLVLRHVDELSYEDIASKLQCKVGTVKSRIARGREMLRMILESADGGWFKR